MSHLCIRCARKALQNGSRTIQSQRTFSSSSTIAARPFVDLSQSLDDSSQPETKAKSQPQLQPQPQSRPSKPQPVKQAEAKPQPAKNPIARAQFAKQAEANQSPPPPSKSETSSRFSSLVQQAVSSSIRRTPSTQPGLAGRQPRQGGQLLRRTPSGPAQPNTGAARPDNRTSSPTGRPSPPGALLLRRTGGPPRGASLNATKDRASGGGPTAGERQTALNRKRARNPRRQSQNAGEQDGDDEDVSDLDAQVEAYTNKYVDPSDNPTTKLAYVPVNPTLVDLRADWPNTPLTGTGLTESVVQKIQYLSRRLPHGWQSAESLAARYHAGEFVSFESAEEKATVLSLAADLAKARADKLSERKGEVVEVEDMGMNTMVARGQERNGLVESVVGGKYTLPQKQRMPFMDGIMRQLSNNETYGAEDMAKFMAKVESLIPAGSGGAGGRKDVKNA